MIAGVPQLAGVFADPLRVEGRAALYSLGFMLRCAAAVRLDVSDSELKVGPSHDGRPYRHGHRAGVYIGYARKRRGLQHPFSVSPPSLNRFLRSLTGPDILGRLSLAAQPQDHGAACHTSCHDCMRDYSNLAYHSILDWRLGLDMARLALDGGCSDRFHSGILAGGS